MIHNTQQALAHINATKVLLDAMDDSSLTDEERAEVRSAGHALNRTMNMMETRIAWARRDES